MTISQNVIEIHSSRPRLLVSVRSAEELPAAISGGADIIDIKETTRGSLGMADIEVIQEIRDQMASMSPLLLSAALGELRDWQENRFKEIQELPELSFVKVGLAEMGSLSDWQSVYTEYQKRLNKKQSLCPNWVSVIYADWMRCDAPPPEEVIKFAIQSGASVVLYDTAIKDGKTLLDHLSVEELNVHAELIHSAGLKLALAGSLKQETVAELVPIQTDIIAIRGAACLKGDRQQTINKKAIAEFKAEMKRVFQKPTVIS